MLAIFLDVQNEILEITREFEVMQTKVRRFESAEDIEDKDSHLNVGTASRLCRKRNIFPISPLF